MNGARGFARFWWGFVIGDDWHLALGAATALATTAALAATGLPAWWAAPAVLSVVLIGTVARSRPVPPDSRQPTDPE